MVVLLVLLGIVALIAEYLVHSKNLENVWGAKVLLLRWVTYGVVALLYLAYSPRFFSLLAILFLAVINIREDISRGMLFSACDFLAMSLIVAGAGDARNEALIGIGIAAIFNGMAYWAKTISEGDFWSGMAIGAALGPSSLIFWGVVAVFVLIVGLAARKREIPVATILYPLAIVFLAAQMIASISV